MYSYHDRVLKLAVLLLLSVTLALIPVSAFAMAAPQCSEEGESCKKDSNCCAGLTCKGSGGDKTCSPRPRPTAHAHAAAPGQP